MPPEADFFDKMGRLNAALSRHEGRPSALAEIDELLTDADVRREFFKMLQSPDWIRPLSESGYFDNLLGSEQAESEGKRYAAWPASNYLVRMASQAPGEVMAILRRIHTDNAFVIGDIVDAALAMPPKVATSLVPVVCQAAREGTRWIHFKDASDLCVRLAEGDEVDAARELAEALFTPASEESRDEAKRRDTYWYKDGLRKVAPILAAVDARGFLPRLCDWLKAAVETRGNVDRESGRDYSDIWRPAIEEHEQNQDYQFAGAVVGCVREGFEQAIRGKALSLDEALRILEEYRYLVFKRLALHLIGEFAEDNVDLARRTMLDFGLFDAHGCKHEHARLLARWFDMLTSDEKERWLEWVRAGPRGKLAEVIADSDDPTEGERRRRYWRFRRLHWVREHLQGKHREFYQEMLAECGEPQMADLSFRVGPARWGSESPMTVGQLSEKTFEEAVIDVSRWKPKERRFMAPDIEGLASTFEQYVATDPVQFSKDALRLKDRPAPFVRKFISQMSKAVGTAIEIDLCAVLDLCDWVLSRPVDERTVPEQEQGALTDEDWQWTRDEISGFLEHVCTAREDDGPRYPLDGLRERLWGLIETLCHDRAKSYVVRDISQEDPRVHDYLNFAINSPRGKAVETALEYARWVANHTKRLEGEKEVVPDGFNAMPEVREMLEWQIARDNRTIEAMAVIGSRIGLIYWIDKQWLADNTARLFPLEEMKEMPFVPAAWAAWNAFLVWGSAHIEFYRLFKTQFAYVVEQAANVELGEGDREEPMRRLGEHLMLLYGRGELGLDADNGLLRQFIEKGNPDVRRHAIGFVGQSLEGDGQVPSDIIERFMELWEVYWAGPGKKDIEEKPDAWLFGLWFSCGRFPDEWALAWLEEFAAMTPTPEPDHAIAERLAKVAHIDPVKSVRVLDRMVGKDREAWRLQSCGDEAKEILREAMKAGGEAREQAVVLINYLGRQGYTEIGQLLNE